MYEIYKAPSIYAHIMNGILLFISAILVYRNYSTISRIAASEKVKLVLLFSLAVGLHGLTHLGLEYMYKFNPLKTAMATSK
jgi:hypothetical protein